MKPIYFPPASLVSEPKHIKVTDLSFLAQTTPGYSIGEIWFDTELGPSKAFIHATVIGRQRLFSFPESHNDGGVELPFSLALTHAVRQYLEHLAGPVSVPILSLGSTIVGAQTNCYWCPFCGAQHVLATRQRGLYYLRGRQVSHPPCESIIPQYLIKPLPKVTPGALITPESFASGSLVLRLSKQLPTRGPK